MIVYKFLWPMFLVSLSDTNISYQNTFSKPDYTTSHNDCQKGKNKDTMNYNYIKTQDIIEENHTKYYGIFH